MLIYDALISDHRKVQRLMDQLVNLGSDISKEDRSDLVQQVRDELVPHSRAEEAVFYNSMRAINTAQDLVWHGYEEHMVAEGLLRTLQAADAVDTQWKAVAKKLQSALNHHIQEEEEKIIPVAKQLFTEEEAAVMCEAFEEMKPQVRAGGFMQNGLDMIANLMPTRLAETVRSYTYKV